MLFDFADNGDYTTRLNYQVTCAYKPNGSGTTRTAYVKNMGWHFARYGGVAHAVETNGHELLAFAEVNAVVVDDFLGSAGY